MELPLHHQDLLFILIGIQLEWEKTNPALILKTKFVQIMVVVWMEYVCVRVGGEVILCVEIIHVTFQNQFTVQYALVQTGMNATKDG